MPRDLSLPQLSKGAATADTVAEGVVVFCLKYTPAAAKGIPKLERRGELEARRKAVENSLKDWSRGMGFGNDLYGSWNWKWKNCTWSG